MHVQMTEKGITYSFTAHATGLEEENRFLRESIENLEREIEKFKHTPLISCEVRETYGSNALIKLPNGNEFLVEVLEVCQEIKPGDTVLAEQKNITIVKKIHRKKVFGVNQFVIVEKPKTSWENIGGLKSQEKEIFWFRTKGYNIK